MASAGPELWLLRHGATAWARSGRHTGSTDLPLLPEGESEASALAPLLARQRFTAVLTSPLQRARRTCELAGLAAQATVCDDLREWDYGAYEGITTAEIRQQVPGWTVWTHPCPEGESITAIETRCRRLLERALELSGPDGRVALFAHGHILRSLAGTWLGLGPAGGALLALDTGSFCVLGCEREQRVLRHWNAPVAAA
ncbi:MAG: histidine phosphatase family protein [Synechococcaceae cyanobacterium]|nr:histidine phosphatase family protein [Synechococcaceae cyanobacterium]